MKEYVIGLDFGTDSVRAVLVDSATGETVESAVHWYPRWREGQYCDASINQWRQHPLDHIEGMEMTIKTVVSQSGVTPSEVRGICIDTTGSSPIALDESGTALSMRSDMSDNPHGMVILWKDHTAIAEAEEINTLSRTWHEGDYTRYVGGIYSSEWFWAKILRTIRVDESVKTAAHTWMEHCDYMTYLLVGEPELDTFKRSRCAAGHKAMWHENWGGLPSEEYLSAFDPYLGALRSRLYSDTYTSDEVAGQLSADWAERLGLTTDCVVAVGTFDAHAGAVGAEVEEGTLVRVMGTSTCDIIVSSSSAVGDSTVKGICGQVDGSVVPGLVGLEAGQSAFGDVLAWWKNVISWPLDHIASSYLTEEQMAAIKSDIIVKLSEAAEKLPISDSAPLALDWVNGRRTPDANQLLKGALVNLSLGTSAAHIFRALVEAICYGSRSIVDRFREEGVQIDTVVGIGGVAKKSGFIMQTLADVLDMQIKVAVSEQAPALGAAMYAAVASGIYTSMGEAAAAMGNGMEKTYHPDPQRHSQYNDLYANYQKLGIFVETQINNK